MAPAPAPPHLGDAAMVREGKRRELKAAMVAHGPEDLEPLRVAVEAAEEFGLEQKDVQPAVQLLQKLEASQQPLTFTDVPRPQMDRLLATTSREQAVAILMQCMGLSLEDGFQSEILAEFHYHNFAFGRSSGFGAEQASTFLSIMCMVHSKAIVEEKLSESEARELFDGLMARHSRQLPPFSVGAFSREEAAKVIEYANRSFFRHYKMYAFAYAQRQDLWVRVVDERVAPKMPAFTELHRQHELDPREVPELRELFRDPQADEAAASAADTAPGAAARRRVTQAAIAAGGEAPAPPASEHESHVAAAIDEAMQAHMPSFESRMELPE